jgi:phosphoserine aminotransferase
MQGGARMQFAFVPLNLLHQGKSADYLVTGTWAKQAHEEATLVAAAYGARARKVISTEVDKKFTRVPAPSELTLEPDAAYVHLTSNNTLFGTQWASYPETGSVPLVADMTSDFGSRVIDWSKVAVAYAGAQKNIGPAGVTVVVARKDLVAGGRTDRSSRSTCSATPCARCSIGVACPRSRKSATTRRRSSTRPSTRSRISTARRSSARAARA